MYLNYTKTIIKKIFDYDIVIISSLKMLNTASYLRISTNLWAWYTLVMHFISNTHTKHTLHSTALALLYAVPRDTTSAIPPKDMPVTSH